MPRYSALPLATVTAASLLTVAHPATAEPCVPPRILIVMDASSTMLDRIDPNDLNSPEKWATAQSAIQTVLTTFPDDAEYGLMLFPGAAAQCSTGEVVVDIAASTGSTILSTLASSTPPSGGAHTPAGQSLMAASQDPLLTDPTYPGYVIFVADGWQWCSVENGTVCATAADCTAMGVSPCPTCDPNMAGCACVRTWPVLGAQALAAEGVDTYVVGFGASVDFRTLNQTADAGGTALPNCDPNADTASCYFQASVPSELTNALSQIIHQVVTEACQGPCGISGTRTCQLSGWTDCDAPDTVDCMSTCDTPGTQTCVNGALTECSSEGDCGGAGGTGTGATGGAIPTGGAGGAGNLSGDDDEIEEESSCGCRTVGSDSPSGSYAWLLLLAPAAALRRARSRRRSI